MPLHVVVITTKPDLGSAEYAIRDSGTGEFTVHGVQIPVSLEALSPEQRTAIETARAIMQAAAEADALAKGLLPSP